ncbi:lactosylceramide 4-alpha-galactosyltransferase isoform X1 [Nasonia vitripennis]|uniref:Alpha 1,4-glycosyltransferase domain-containing protein n=1 Tax=Nasonia vitripennis TaxID=7425 RepID=A0A7M7G5P0_NASVI|nr:lactosylceramide 4-alpha-galactosyltransferase isoform X1 [Nasonia vitripennis]
MKMKKRFAAVILFFLMVFLFVLLTNDEILRSMQLPMMGQSADMDVSCYEKLSTRDSFPEFNTPKERIRLASGKNIFFHETSCFESGRSELNCRQACAVESAARMNPSTSVNLLFLSPSPPSNRTARLVDLVLQSYRNVRVMRVQVDEYVRDSPIEQWYASGILGSSHWPRSHMSDIMRYLTLWKFGGVYLDLDVVVTTSLEDLTDFAGAEDWMDVAAGVIGFGATGLGRRVANACLRDLMRNFRGNLWGNNGPGVITRTLQKFCAVEHAKDMTSSRCSGFRVFPPSAFYPIFYKEWRRYFSAQDFNETMRLIQEARAIHVWNKLSATEVVRVGSKVPYAIVAQKHCPRVYSNCGSTF